MSHTVPADARAAASLLLLRDGPQGLEVLLLRKAEKAGDQRSGITAFPGGVLDPRDAAAPFIGPDDAVWSARLGLPSGGIAYALAAVRETFEEVGLLLTDPAVDALAAHAWRDRLRDNATDFASFCAHFGCRADVRGLHYLSHWLTPPGAPKRFDTRFFACAAPEGQEPRADDGEAVEVMWLRPGDALAPERGLKLLPVTRETLKDLARFQRRDEALADIAARPSAGVTMPRRALTRRGPGVVLPSDLAYAEVAHLDPDGRRADVRDHHLAGLAVQLSARVWRVTAPNPGVMTGPGTNTYLVSDTAGQGWTVIDPGPVDPQHLDALLAALRLAGGEGARLERVIATHTHRDHSPGAAPLALATGAQVVGWRTPHPTWQDDTFQPTHEPADGERLAVGRDTTLRVLHTPGHASNHLCLLLEEEALLFTGDHLMQGSTVVINPPDGDMGAYLRSLEALLDLPLRHLAPGHGFLVGDPHSVIRQLIAHRLRREAKVLKGLQQCQPSGAPAGLADLVVWVYDDVPPALHTMAERSLLAHLLKLQAEGRVVASGEGWALA